MPPKRKGGHEEYILPGARDLFEGREIDPKLAALAQVRWSSQTTPNHRRGLLAIDYAMRPDEVRPEVLAWLNSEWKHGHCGNELLSPKYDAFHVIAMALILRTAFQAGHEDVLAAAERWHRAMAALLWAFTFRGKVLAPGCRAIAGKQPLAYDMVRDVLRDLYSGTPMHTRARRAWGRSRWRAQRSNWCAVMVSSLRVAGQLPKMAALGASDLPRTAHELHVHRDRDRRYRAWGTMRCANALHGVESAGRKETYHWQPWEPPAVSSPWSLMASGGPRGWVVCGDPQLVEAA